MHTGMHAHRHIHTHAHTQKYTNFVTPPESSIFTFTFSDFLFYF